MMDCGSDCRCRGRIGYTDRATRASPRAPTGLGHSASVSLCVFEYVCCGLLGAALGLALI